MLFQSSCFPFAKTIKLVLVYCFLLEFLLSFHLVLGFFLLCVSAVLCSFFHSLFLPISFGLKKEMKSFLRVLQHIAVAGLFSAWVFTRFSSFPVQIQCTEEMADHIIQQS